MDRWNLTMWFGKRVKRNRNLQFLLQTWDLKDIKALLGGYWVPSQMRSWWRAQIQLMALTIPLSTLPGVSLEDMPHPLFSYLALIHSLWGKLYKCSFQWVTDSRGAINNVAKQTPQEVTKRCQPSHADHLCIIQAATAMMQWWIILFWVGLSIVVVKWNNQADHQLEICMVQKPAFKAADIFDQLLTPWTKHYPL